MLKNAYRTLLRIRKEVSDMEDYQWHDFMKNSEYKKYQDTTGQNRPYLDKFQANLMEKYEISYFRGHPLEPALNQIRNNILVKTSIHTK